MVGLAAGNLGDLFGNHSLLVNAGPGLTLPILDGGRLRNQLAGSDADYDLAVAGYDQALLAAMREVADAVQSARSLDAQLAAASRATTRARRSTLASLRYKAGIASQIDVLNVQKPCSCSNNRSRSCARTASPRRSTSTRRSAVVARLEAAHARRRFPPSSPSVPATTP